MLDRKGSEDKMEKVLQQKNIRIVLWVLLAGMMITFVLPCYFIQWEDYDKLGITEYIDKEESCVTPLGCFVELVEMDFDEIKYVFTDDIECVGYQMNLLTVAAYLILFINVLLFIRSKWNKKCFTILHTISLLIPQGYYFILYRLKNVMLERMNEEIGDWWVFFGGVAESTVSKVINIFIDALSVGYWIFTICGILIYVVLLLDSKMVRRHFDTTKKSEDNIPYIYNDDVVSVTSNPRLKVLSGKYTGAVLNLQNEESIIIGRNPQFCHLILEAPGVSGEHCVIRYSKKDKKFYVLDKSLNGTFQIMPENQESIPLRKEIEECLPSGAIITIGKNGERIQLFD